MAGEKEIRSKIASVKNMQKITSAMEKVAASKIRKAQKQMEASRPYAERIRRVVGHLAHANPDYKHPYLTEREVKRVADRFASVLPHFVEIVDELEGEERDREWGDGVFPAR